MAISNSCWKNHDTKAFSLPSNHLSLSLVSRFKMPFRINFGGSFLKGSRKVNRHTKYINIQAILQDSKLPEPSTSFDASLTSTYGCDNGEWLKDEENRLLSTKTHFEEGILLTRGKWSWNVSEDNHYRLCGKMHFSNLTNKSEIFICEVLGKVTLLSQNSVENITKKIEFVSHNEGLKERKDGYWQSFIIKAKHKSEMDVIVDLYSNSGINSFKEGFLKDIQCIRIDVDFISYGPNGRKKNLQSVILPLQFSSPFDKNSEKWIKVEDSELSVCAVKTHLLCHQDDPKNILKYYATNSVRPDDVIAIGETPLALMEGRFRNPKFIRPSLLSLFVCRLFHPTSSLATACGMQALIDIVGKFRVFFSVLGAIASRLFGVRGMFYNLAGPQARLIDDVTGTLPPYDQFITLGPLMPKRTVESLKKEMGCEIAIVDVNDLKKVQILATTNGVDEKLLTQALQSNPAGNADEQTPIVIIRGASKKFAVQPKFRVKS